MKKTRFLALLAALLLLIGSVLLLASCKKGEEPGPDSEGTETRVETEGDFSYYLLEDDTYAVAPATSASFEGALEIPAEFNGKAVTQVGYEHEEVSGAWVTFSSMPLLTSVSLPAGIKTLSPYAFSLCEALVSVQFSHGGSLCEIGNSAFKGCINLGAKIKRQY